jgi:hypothetical protein
LSSFGLTLDTTSPILQIIAPTEVNTVVDNTISIESNEEIDTFQEIYFIDSEGTRVDYIFNQIDEFNLEKTIRFVDAADGLGVLYIKLRDEVYNLTTIAWEIYVRTGMNLMVTAVDYNQMKIEVSRIG